MKGAAVTLESDEGLDSHAVTGPDGHFQVPWCEAAYWVTARGEQGVARASAREGQGFVLRLYPERELRGRVVDLDGNPLQAWVVVQCLLPLEGGKVEASEQRIECAPDGSFRVGGIPSGAGLGDDDAPRFAGPGWAAVRVLAADPGEFQGVEREVLIGPQGHAPLVLELPRRRRLEGRVLSRAGAPLPGAELSRLGTPWLGPALSDAEGRFVFEDTTERDVLEVQARGFVPGRFAVDRPDRPLELILEPGARLEGRVLTQGRPGQAALSARVPPGQPEPWPGWVHHALTDPQGGFVLEGLPPEVLLQAGDGAPVRVRPGEGEVVLRVEADGLPRMGGVFSLGPPGEADDEQEAYEVSPGRARLLLAVRWPNTAPTRGARVAWSAGELAGEKLLAPSGLPAPEPVLLSSRLPPATPIELRITLLPWSEADPAPSAVVRQVTLAAGESRTLEVELR